MPARAKVYAYMFIYSTIMYRYDSNIVCWFSNKSVLRIEFNKTIKGPLRKVLTRVLPEHDQYNQIWYPSIYPSMTNITKFGARVWPI